MDICIAPHSRFGSRASIERTAKPALFTTPEIANTVSTKVGVAPRTTQFFWSSPSCKLPADFAGIGAIFGRPDWQAGSRSGIGGL